jgi:hypothetical protein
MLLLGKRNDSTISGNNSFKVECNFEKSEYLFFNTYFTIGFGSFKFANISTLT